MASARADTTVARRRQRSRISLLKRRATAASILGFAAFLGLAAQHVVKGTGSTSALSSVRLRSHTTFFDQTTSDFSFDDQGFAHSQPSAPQVQPSSAPPVSQSSVS